MTLTLAGAERVKLGGVAGGGTAIVSAMVVLALRLPEAPVMVTVDVPTAAELAAAKVTVRLVATVMNVAVTPAGSPEAVSATAPAKPF